MDREPGRLRRERATVRAMVEIYCRHHHRGAVPCADCAVLADYADRRLDRCPYGAEKPTCVNCPIHCYQPEPRERMREVMRFAGPRMLWRRPYLAVMHLLDGWRLAPERPRRARQGL